MYADAPKSGANQPQSSTMFGNTNSSQNQASGVSQPFSKPMSSMSGIDYSKPSHQDMNGIEKEKENSEFDKIFNSLQNQQKAQPGFGGSQSMSQTTSQSTPMSGITTAQNPQGLGAGFGHNHNSIQNQQQPQPGFGWGQVSSQNIFHSTLLNGNIAAQIQNSQGLGASSGASIYPNPPPTSLYGNTSAENHQGPSGGSPASFLQFGPNSIFSNPANAAPQIFFGSNQSMSDSSMSGVNNQESGSSQFMFQNAQTMGNDPFNNVSNNLSQNMNFGANQSAQSPLPNTSSTFDFTFGGAPSTSQAPPSFVFGSSSQSTAPVIFGGNQATQQPTSNIFGTAATNGETPKMSFGQSTPQTSSQNNQQSGQPPFSFGQSVPTTNSTMNFGSPKVNPFATLNQPSAPTPNLSNGHDSQPEFNGTNQNNQNSSQSSGVFGASTPLFPSSSSTLNTNQFVEPEKTGVNGASNYTSKTPSSYSQLAPPENTPSKSNNVFSSAASLSLPSTANQPPLSGMFPPLSQSAPKTPASNTLSQTSNTPQAQKMAPEAGDKLAIEKCQMKMTAIMNKADNEYLLGEPLPPAVQEAAKSNPAAINSYVAICRLKDMNVAMSNMWATVHWSMDPAELLNNYMDQRVAILKATGFYAGPLKRKVREDDVDTRPQKRANTEFIAQAQANQPLPNGGAVPAVNHSFEAPVMNAGKPADQVATTSTESQSLNTAPLTNGSSSLEPPRKSKLFSGSPSKSPFLPGRPGDGPTVDWKNLGKTTPALSPSAPKGKRKAEDELTQNTEAESPVRPLRATKNQKVDGSFSPAKADEGSNTSAIFSSILNTPVAKPKILAGKTANKTTTVDKPRVNPFGALPVPQSTTTSTPEPSTATRSHAFNPTLSASPTPSTFSIKGHAFGNSFKPLDPKDVTEGATKDATKDATSSAPSPFSFGSSLKATSSVQSDSASPKPTQPAVAAPFQFKPQTSTSTPSSTPLQWIPPPPTSAGNGLPQFGALSGGSAMEQFREKAKKEEEAREAKMMEEAKDADWESDDETESEYERKWYAKRAIEKEQQKKDIEAASKSGGFTFKPTQSTTSTAASSLFAPSAGNSAANSLNGSRTSTPGPTGSASGSVLGGAGPTQPVKNIFGHVSDTGSGKDGKDDESDHADDEEESEVEETRTPAEETGTGIASAQKPLFGFSNASSGTSAQKPSFGFSNGTSSPVPDSGTTTPGRSLFDRVGPKPIEKNDEKPVASPMTGGLFDRIGKDSNGSSEEKENTQPTPSSLYKTSFGTSSIFSKSATAPADQTWKQDSPIKFGNSTATAPPSLSFTASTPTKTPSGLFGTSSEASKGSIFGQSSTTASPGLFSGLLGSNGTNGKAATPSVGFGFGAAPSTTSSLFPSVAGSAATSRGTSPGGTTDGAASDADGDPDAEKHEQIDLTSTGQGEEDEEVIYEVRAKALNFDNGDNKWNTAGLGPLRVLKHKETGVSRVLIRADPSGKIILNHGILNIPYKAEGKTVKFVAAGGDDKLETYLLQVKTPESAEKLAEILTDNKAN